MGVCGSVQDLTPGVIAVVKSSAPTCCLSIVVWRAGFFARIVLDSGSRVGGLVTGAPMGLNCVLYYFCTARSLVRDFKFDIGVRGWRSWLRNFAVSRKVVGTILDGVFGIFQ